MTCARGLPRHTYNDKLNLSYRRDLFGGRSESPKHRRGVGDEGGDSGLELLERRRVKVQLGEDGGVHGLTKRGEIESIARLAAEGVGDMDQADQHAIGGELRGLV